MKYLTVIIVSIIILFSSYKSKEPGYGKYFYHLLSGKIDSVLIQHLQTDTNFIMRNTKHVMNVDPICFVVKHPCFFKTKPDSLVVRVGLRKSRFGTGIVILREVNIVAFYHNKEEVISEYEAAKAVFQKVVPKHTNEFPVTNGLGEVIGQSMSFIYNEHYIPRIDIDQSKGSVYSFNMGYGDFYEEP